VSEVVLPASSAARRRRGGDLLIRTAFRNVGRNRRRTWLTAGGIGFAVFLITSSIALQDGSYVGQRQSATGLLTGHVQVVHPSYPDDARFEQVVGDVGARLHLLRATPGVRAASARVQAYALISRGERSFAAQVLGMDIESERDIVRFFDTVRQGRAPQSAEETLIGSALARNLGAAVGDELVLLGSGKEGGIAALVLTVSGIYQTGISDVDRAVLVAPLRTVQSAFSLGDEAHVLVAVGADPLTSEALSEQLGVALGPDVRVRTWQEIMPEVEQGIELDRVSGDFMYGIVMILVGFSVVNTFIMVMFERTREFGMLLALGLKPWSIIRMVQLEAFALWALGTLLGWLLAAPLIAYLMVAGISFGEAMEQLAEQMYMPSSIHAAMTWRALLTAPLVMLVATQVAAFLPSLRLRRMQPVTALRQES
jgi:ABC-type lipoprotein release transport system permease subunit